jgi:prefoldin subunit 5
MEESSESEVITQEVSTIAARVSALDARLREVETVIDRLEAAAATTARALDEVSSHWEAVYRAMRRAE